MRFEFEHTTNTTKIPGTVHRSNVPIVSGILNYPRVASVGIETEFFGVECGSVVAVSICSQFQSLVIDDVPICLFSPRVRL